MRIGLQTWGSEGDCRPLLALAHGLKARGHTVTLVVTNVEGRAWAPIGDSLGIPTRDIGFDWYVAHREQCLAAMKDIIGTRDDIRQIRLTLEGLLVPVHAAMLEASDRLCAENDLVVGHFLADSLLTSARKSGRRYISVVTAAAIPSRTVTPTGLPRWGETMNSVWWRIARASMNLQLRPVVNRLRQLAGASPVSDALSWLGGSGDLNLISNSPTLLPRPPDWDPRHLLCGFFDLPAHAAAPIPEDVGRFLGAGSPPVYITFGSMLTADPDDGHLTATVEAVIQGALRAGARAIVQAPWERVGRATESPAVLRVGKSDHASLFPRCAAVVHHCGAGTTQAACLAGKPSVPVPFLNDQPMWAERLVAAGLAPGVLPRRKLSAARLAPLIRAAASTPALAAAARDVGDKMRAENGVRTAVEAIEAHLSRSR